mgnify:CR=1 FL=1|tara:strand:+ start:953 stop:1636 length:684 start_codon:yes stop_codon:yes gene_type:complete
MKITNTKDGSAQKKSYLIFGATKTGKTLLAATLPSSDVLLVNTENNLDSLYGADINTVAVQSYDEFMEVLNAIESGSITPKWLYLDSVSDLMTKIFNDLKKEIKDGRQVYAAFEEKYGDVIAKFKSLPCNVVAIARQTQVKDEITGGLIFGAALPWAKLQSDLPYNFSAVLATRCEKGEEGQDYYSLQCHPDSQYQVGVRTQFGKPNPLNRYEDPDLEAIHNKITQS